MNKYGLISATDAACIEKIFKHIITVVFDEDKTIHTCELGIFNGDTSRWFKSVIEENGRKCSHIAIDNHADFHTLKPFEECLFLEGNTRDIYYLVPDTSVHLLFVDANHSYPSVISDFFCYRNKIKKGGYMVFHDTSKYIAPFKDWQKVGNQLDIDTYISVRRALRDIGLLDNKFENWKLIMDECDPNDAAGGVVIIKRIA